MSVSSHLTPEPERRLWIILENMRHGVVWTDAKIGALCVFAAAELVFARSWLLAFAMPLGVLALSPLIETKRRLPWLEPALEKPATADCLIIVEDVAKYALGDLILRLDRYLGGGITATQYYEDIVSQILLSARIAERKGRLLWVMSVLVGLGQFAVAGRLLGR